MRMKGAVTWGVGNEKPRNGEREGKREKAGEWGSEEERIIVC